MESTSHGLPHVAKRKNVALKVLWLVCLLASASVCSYLVYSSIDDYIGWDTVSKIEIIQEIPTYFPTVSICNLNQLSTNFSIQFMRDLLIENGLMARNETLEQSYPNSYQDRLFWLKFFVANNAYNQRNFSDSLKQQFSFRLEHMMLSCMYNLDDCTADDFEWYFDTFYGNCYRFNSGFSSNRTASPDKLCTKAGKINGLQVELFVGDPMDISSLATTKGVHVIVHNKSIRPQLGEGMDAPTGMDTSFIVNREFKSKISDPYSDCRDDIETSGLPYVETLKRYNLTYQQMSCFDVCYQSRVMENCGCYDNTYSVYSDDRLKPCMNYTQVVCNSVQYSLFYSQDPAQVCGDQCPLECDSVAYHVSTAYSDYPTTAYAEYLKNNPIFRARFPNNTQISYESIKKNVLSLGVFYGTISYQKYSELKKTSLIDLVSNIGGTMGLFIGISFLSFVELVDVFLLILFAVCKNLINKNKTASSDI